jgi:hypothetical protein
MNNTFLKNNDILKFVERMNQTRLSKKKKLCVVIRFINNILCPPG